MDIVDSTVGSPDLPTSVLGTSPEAEIVPQGIENLIVVDAGVREIETLLSGLELEQAAVHVLNSTDKGIDQLTALLEKYNHLDSLHLFTHGQSGQLQLGESDLNSNTLAEYDSLIGQWSESFNQAADLLLYGCNVAAGESGHQFLQQLNQQTGLDIAASDDLTGMTALGGDGRLEFALGNIESPLAVQDEFLATLYPALLAKQVTSEVIGEVGRINNFNTTQTTINFDHTYDNPVIFANPLSYEGGDPSIVRITDIQSDSFTAFLEEPEYKDFNHKDETFSYLVLEAGTWQLDNGATLEVGTLDSNLLATEGWESISFDSDFSDSPLVFSTIQTNNGPDWVVPRLKNISSDGFEMTMQEEEAREYSGHTTETLGWMALSLGKGNWSDFSYQAAMTGDVVTDDWHTVNFSDNITTTPYFLASIATFDGGDPSGLRYTQINQYKTSLKIEEEQSEDQETNHTTENVNFLALAGSGLLSGIPVDPFAPGVLNFSHSRFASNEDGTPMVQVKIDRTDGSYGEVSTTLMLKDGSATGHLDYDNTPIEVTFAHRETSKVVNIPLIDDLLNEEAENFNLELTSPTGGVTLGEQNTAMFFIADNDIPSPPSSENVVFPRDAGVVDVTSYGAIPNDNLDDTAAIQDALNNNSSQNKIIYFPDGQYLISDTLRLADSQKRTIFQGQNRDSTILKLQDHLDFDGAMLDIGTSPAQNFRNSLRNFTVNIGTGNPNAVGVRFMANNQGTISNLNILSEDGQGDIGLDLAPDENGPLFVENVYVRGFDTGIRTWNPTASQTFEQIRLENQNQYGWRNFNQNVFVRDLQSVNTVPVIWNLPNGASEVTLLDGHLIGVGEASNVPAIHNQKGMYVQNLTTTGYDLAILQDDKGRGNPSQPDGYVAEWIAQGDEYTSLFDSDSDSIMMNLPVKEVPDVPWDDLSDWVSPLDYGGLPSDDIDDTAAIQAAIDSGASTVYLPNGSWTLNGTVKLRGNVHRFLGTEAWLEGGGTLRLVDGTSSVVVVERMESGQIHFVHDSDRTWVLSSLFVEDYRNTAQGTGDLFVRDVVGGPWQITHQDVWARQWNPEPQNPVTRVVNDGGNVWVLGYKTEDEGTLIETLNGGQTELYGGYILNGDFGDIPAFINNESSLSYAGVTFRSFDDGTIQTGVEETRNGVTLSTQGLFKYYNGFQ